MNTQNDQTFLEYIKEQKAIVAARMDKYGTEVALIFAGLLVGLVGYTLFKTIALATI